MLRREDERVLKGTSRYTADWNLPGQLHAFVLCAVRPAGITHLDMPASPDRIWRVVHAARGT